MIPPRLALALRNLAALALAAPVACVVDNPGFMFDRESTRTGTGTASSIGSTGLVDDATTADATTDTRPPSTTVSTLPSDTTGVSSASDGSTTAVPDTDGCTETSVKIPAEADGFYIAGGTEGGMSCEYIEPITDMASPCKFLNFGANHGMRVVRAADAYEAMYAVRFSKAELLKLKQDGVTSASAQLFLNVYAAPPPIDMQVGMINEAWFEGLQNGTPAKPGDSNFGTAKIDAMVDTKWTGLDGPRGASTKVSTLSVPAGYPPASFIKTEKFPIDVWLAAPDLAEGLVVSFEKNDAIGADGPAIHTRDNPDPSLHPYLLVHFCAP